VIERRLKPFEKLCKTFKGFYNEDDLLEQLRRKISKNELKKITDELITKDDFKGLVEQHQTMFKML
jgi:hypothetical protein